MKRVISSGSGLIHSFRQDEPNNVEWDRKNCRFNYVASTAWHYFNERKVNPFVPYSVAPYPKCWACPTQCHGDANCDGKVDDDDLDQILNALSYPVPLYVPCVDFNRDGIINIIDLNIINASLYTNPIANCVPGGP